MYATDKKIEIDKEIDKEMTQLLPLKVRRVSYASVSYFKDQKVLFLYFFLAAF